MLSLLLPAVLAVSAPALDATDETLEVATSSTSTLDVQVSWVDFTTSSGAPAGSGSQRTQITTATTTTVLAAPASSTTRGASLVKACNVGSASQVVTLKHDKAATESVLGRAVLAANECASWDAAGTLTVYSSAGVPKRAASEFTGTTGLPLSWAQKVGTASEAVAVRYGNAKDTGTPGAWAPGTPGLNGTADDCSTTAGAAVAGSPVLPTPAGGWYLTYGAISATVVHSFEVYDLIWHNTGLVVTTTTAQAITQPSLGARDAAGSTNGLGWIPAIYVTTATTNAGAVTNTTLSYTDQDNNAGNTATISSFPATAVAGTLVPFQLAAGDTGVRSVQSVTLGTSYGGGAISLVLLRPLWRLPVTLANVGTVALPPQTPGVRLYNGTCLWLAYISGATTATTSSADLWVMDR